jgi:peptide subunit release factor 1 (eRF1)
VVEDGRLTASKVGSRHVQGRSAAGGWSQQRFARRREGQAREAAGAAADTVARVLLPESARLDTLVTGGDRAMVDTVLEEARLKPLRAIVGARFLAVPQALAVRVRVEEPGGEQRRGVSP